MSNKSRNKPIDILLEGWLHKKTKQLNRWRRKWIVLSTEYLYTFKTQEIDKNASEILTLSDIASVKINNATKAFMLIDGKHATFQFQCDTQLQAQEWMNTIIAFIDTLKCPIRIDCKRNIDFCCTFALPIPYKIGYKYTVHTIITRIVTHIQSKYIPIHFEPIRLLADSFMAKQIEYNAYDWDKSDINITDFSKENICEKGIHLFIDIAIYKHHISTHRTCPNLLKSPKICPIYNKLRYQSICDETYLQHITEHSHNNTREKCTFEPCYAHNRLVEGGYDLKDRIHIQLYAHKPRQKRYELCTNMECFSLNDEYCENKPIYATTIQDMIDEGMYKESDGYLNTLIKEIISNGFKRDLCMSDNDMKCENYSILSIVDTLLGNKRHKQMGSPLNRSEMLALVLYTQSECNYNICHAQAVGNDYKLWKWFDFCLYSAIQKLHNREYGKYKLFTAFKKSESLQNQFIECGFFKTYVSTTWLRDIAFKFVNDKNENILFEIDEEFRNSAICCDVSWISKFGKNECEVLIARSIDAQINCFECQINTNTIELSVFGAAEMRKQLSNTISKTQKSKKYPLMRTLMDTQWESNKILYAFDILSFIDGITEDIIFGYLRQLLPFYTSKMPCLIQTLVALYYFNVYERSLYLYPEYVSSANLNKMLLFEPERVCKYPNIAFHSQTQQLAIGTALANNKYCLFVYDLNITTTKEIKLKSSKVHSSPITALTFDKNGSFLITYFAQECLLKIWDIRTKKNEAKQKQICIKTVEIEELTINNCKDSMIQHLINANIKWDENGVILQRENKSVLPLPKIKSNKTYKTLIFIIEGSANNPSSKNKKKKSESSLSNIGIDEAYNLSQYINKHSPIMNDKRKTKPINNIGINDALYALEIGILSDNTHWLLPPGVISKLEEIRTILQDANGVMHRFHKRDKDTNIKSYNKLIANHCDINPNSIVSDYYKDIDEFKSENNRFSVFETQLKNGWVLDQMISDSNSSIVCCSNQRRCISTAMIALWDRFQLHAKDQLHLNAYLQELGYPLSELKVGKEISVSEFELKSHKFSLDLLKHFYAKKLICDKALDLDSVVFGKKSFDEQLRLELFCFWSFFSQITKKVATIIICAHRKWFNAFLNKYLPKNASFSKAKKVPNCSVVGFRMCCIETPTDDEGSSCTYQIVEKSITNIYRGFK